MSKISKLVQIENDDREINPSCRDLQKGRVLDLICFSFLAWFATNNVPKTSAKFGQQTKNEGQNYEDPTRNNSVKGESVQILGAVRGSTLRIIIYFIVDI